MEEVPDGVEVSIEDRDRTRAYEHRRALVCGEDVESGYIDGRPARVVYDPEYDHYLLCVGIMGSVHKDISRMENILPNAEHAFQFVQMPDGLTVSVADAEDIEGSDGEPNMAVVTGSMESQAEMNQSIEDEYDRILREDFPDEPPLSERDYKTWSKRLLERSFEDGVFLTGHVQSTDWYLWDEGDRIYGCVLPPTAAWRESEQYSHDFGDMEPIDSVLAGDHYIEYEYDGDSAHVEPEWNAPTNISVPNHLLFVAQMVENAVAKVKVQHEFFPDSSGNTEFSADL